MSVIKLLAVLANRTTQRSLTRRVLGLDAVTRNAKCGGRKVAAIARAVVCVALIIGAALVVVHAVRVVVGANHAMPALPAHNRRAGVWAAPVDATCPGIASHRSEERRVGKECA